MTCPKCGEKHAHRSHRRGFRDRVYRAAMLIPYRCRSCQARFYAYRAGEKSSRMRSSEERRIMALRRRMKWKNSKRQLGAYLIAVLIMVAVVYYLIQQRVVSQ
jgi:hypothetical protein